MADSFVNMAIQKSDKNLKEVEDDLMKFFKELKNQVQNLVIGRQMK